MEFVRNLISRCNVPRRERNRCGSKPEKSLRPNTPEKYTDFLPFFSQPAIAAVIFNGHFPFSFILRRVGCLFSRTKRKYTLKNFLELSIYYTHNETFLYNDFQLDVFKFDTYRG